MERGKGDGGWMGGGQGMKGWRGCEGGRANDGERSVMEYKVNRIVSLVMNIVVISLW